MYVSDIFQTYIQLYGLAVAAAAIVVVLVVVVAVAEQ
jgi:hypothetical protein